MAKSLRSTPGEKQVYNLYDPDEIYRAQKAINERINQIAKTFGSDSQIYRDYVAPLTVGSLSPHIRLDKSGLTKFRTGKNNQNADVVYTLERMLTKSTAGEILQRTAEQMDKAINITQARATKKKVVSRKDVVLAAKSMHDLEIQVYGRLDELYDYAEKKLSEDYRRSHGMKKDAELTKAQKKDVREQAKELINEKLGNRKFMKDIHSSHGKLTSTQLRYAARYFDNKTSEKMLK